jgi:hypothetical protein
VTINGSKFDKNFIVDDIDPINLNLTIDSQFNQSQGFLLIDFAGEIIMGQQTSFENNQGVANSNTMKDFVSG